MRTAAWIKKSSEPSWKAWLQLPNKFLKAKLTARCLSPPKGSQHPYPSLIKRFDSRHKLNQYRKAPPHCARAAPLSTEASSPLTLRDWTADDVGFAAVSSVTIVCIAPRPLRIGTAPRPPHLCPSSRPPPMPLRWPFPPPSCASRAFRAYFCPAAMTLARLQQRVALHEEQGILTKESSMPP